MDIDADIPSTSKFKPDDDDVVYGHRKCRTHKVKWLCLENIYPKFHRCNIYDIGGTYIGDVPDYWFTYKTEQIGNIFLLHIFVGNNHEGTYTIGLSSGNNLQLNRKKNVAYLSETLKYTTYKIKDKKCHMYITTYSFTDLDVEFLKNRYLYISLHVNCNTYMRLTADDVDNVKALHDCRNLLNDPLCSDFVVESEDGAQFLVHKIILMSHSEVFKAMLKDDTAESQNNKVQLVDVATEDVRAMLEYIYTGTCDTENVNFTNLLMLSDRYDLKGMRELCNHALAQQLNNDNALDILTLADMYDSESLRLTALKYIKKNRESLESSSFKEMNNLPLIRELCAYLAS